MKKSVRIILLGLITTALLLGFMPLPAEAITIGDQPIPSMAKYLPGDEIVELRQENSKTFQMEDGKRQLVVSMGAVHYKDNYTNESESWKDIDLTWNQGYVGNAPYELWLDGNLVTVKYKRTGEVTTIELIETGGIPATLTSWEQTEGIAKASGLEIVLGNSGFRFTRIIESDKVPTEAKYRVLGSTAGVSVHARDADGISLEVDYTLEDGILTETLKPDQVTKYPVRIDPTWRVGTGTDDCWRRLTVDEWHLDYNYQQAGASSATNYEYGGGMRFPNIPIPQGTTIEDGTFLTFRAAFSKDGTTVNTRISAEDVDNAVTFADNAATFDARWANRTTAKVDWDAIPAWTGGVDYDSPEIKTVIKEIVDRPGWNSEQDIVIFWEDFDDRSTHASNAFRYGNAYEESTTTCTLLTIAYLPLPTVTTQAVDNIADVTATGHGTIVATGNGNSEPWAISDASTASAKAPAAARNIPSVTARD